MRVLCGSHLRRIASVALLFPAAAAALAGAPYPVVAGLGIAAFGALLALRPGLGVGIFIVARGLADLAGENRFRVGPLELNLASVLAAALIAGAIPLLAIRWRAGRLRIPPGARWLAALLGVALLGVLVGWTRLGTEGLRLGAREWVRLLSLLAFFLVAYHAFEDARGARVLEWIVVASIALAALLGLVQIAAGRGAEDPSTGVLRATGPFAYANPLAFAILVAWNRFVARAAARIARVGEYALGVLLFAAFAATRSLTGLVLLPISLPFLLAGRARRFALAAVVLALAGILALPGTRRRIGGIARSLARGEAAQGAPGANSLTWRIATWRAILPACGPHPVLGWGLKSSIAPIELGANPVPHWQHPERGVEPHNDYLRFLFELGAVGLAAFLLFHAGVLAWLDRLRRRLAGRPWGAEARALETTYAVLLLGAFFTNLTDFTAPLIFLWAMIAAVARAAAAPPGPPRPPARSDPS